MNRLARGEGAKDLALWSQEVTYLAPIIVYPVPIDKFVIGSTNLVGSRLFKEVTRNSSPIT